MDSKRDKENCDQIHHNNYEIITVKKIKPEGVTGYKQV
jgi:hypothetical protein